MWHSSSAEQTLAAPPVQTAAWQVSPVVQALPSSQGVSSGLAELVHCPVAESQVPATWQASLAVQAAMHAPPQAICPVGHGVQRLAAPGPLTTQTNPAQQVWLPSQGCPVLRQAGAAPTTPRPAREVSPPIIPLTTDRRDRFLAHLRVR
jgi:hypothetical protein